MSGRYSETDRVFDELLLTRLQAGDRAAGERLAARWYPRLMRTAYRLLGDEGQARSAVQEAWTGICKGWHSLRKPSHFAAWSYRILHHKCVDRIRANQSQRLKAGEMNVEPSVAPAGEHRVSIDQAFARLSADHRIAATLHFAAGLTIKETAQATGVPLGTAKTRIFHARKQLKSMLDEDCKEEKQDDAI